MVNSTCARAAADRHGQFYLRRARYLPAIAGDRHYSVTLVAWPDASHLLLRVRTEVFVREQAVPQADDRLPHLFRGGFDGGIAFAVETDRTVVQVRGADPQEHVVDDDELGMDENLALVALAIGNDRVIDAKPAISVGFAQAPD